MKITIESYDGKEKETKTIVVSEEKAKVIRKKIKYLVLKKEEKLKQMREDFKNGKYDHMFK